MSRDAQKFRREPPPELASVTDGWVVGPFHFYDVVVLSLVAFFTVGLFVVGPPLIIDDFYHMGVAQQIYRLGFVPTWDFWEYAPVGRPNLYPPLLHVAMALLMKVSGGDVFFAARVVKVATYPILVLCFWYSARGFTGRKAAFYSTMALASASPLLLVSYMIMPASLVLALTCLLFLTFTRKMLLPSIALMAVMLWLHISMPLLTIVALLAFSLVRRREGYLVFFLKVFGFSVLLYSPWLVHVAAHMSWLSSAQMPGGIFIPLIVWALGLPALVLSFRCYRADYFVYTLYTFSLIPVFFGYGMRFWVYVVVPVAFFVGVTLSRHVGSRGGKWRDLKIILVLVLVASALLVTPAIGGEMQAQAGTPPLLRLPPFLSPTPFLFLLLWPPPARSMITPDLLPIYLASGWIMVNTQPFQPICYMGSDMFDASAITAFTGRPTTGGMWREVMNPLVQMASHLYITDLGTVYVVGPPFATPPPSVPCTLAADFGPIKIFVRT
ncbi:MAG: hypothetical protein Q6352_014245 [Candidatus Freyrarchaeum guaymaensis]|nr:hypothetical protein [Candidatus Sigynarchaeota archaeon]